MQNITHRVGDILSIKKSTKEKELPSTAKAEQTHTENDKVYGIDIDSVLIVANQPPRNEFPDRIVGENFIIQRFSYQHDVKDGRSVQIQIQPKIDSEDGEEVLEAELATRVHDGKQTRTDLETVSLETRQKFAARDVLALYRHHHLEDYRFHSRGSEGSTSWNVGSRYWK